ADVAPEIVEPLRASRCPCRLRDLRHAAQSQRSPPPRFRRAQPAPQVLLHLHLQVEAQLLIQLAVLTRPIQESAEPFPQLGDQAHGLLLRSSGWLTQAPLSHAEPTELTQRRGASGSRGAAESAESVPGRAALIVSPSLPCPGPRSSMNVVSSGGIHAHPAAEPAGRGRLHPASPDSPGANHPNKGSLNTLRSLRSARNPNQPSAPSEPPRPPRLRVSPDAPRLCVSLERLRVTERTEDAANRSYAPPQPGPRFTASDARAQLSCARASCREPAGVSM